MNNDQVSKNWQKSIIAESEQRLNRDLTEAERKFITLRSGGIALEFIQDTVNSTEGKELEKYLNSENND
jgi:hypothetical protein